ncbi:MAG TPA: hypothetical protein VND95_05025 [Stellaceae bacterium]|nr:hypothetical protein [Stellaceae bacterium]
MDRAKQFCLGGDRRRSLPYTLAAPGRGMSVAAGARSPPQVRAGHLDGRDQHRQIGKAERRLIKPHQPLAVIGAKPLAAQRHDRQAPRQGGKIVDIVLGHDQIGHKHIKTRPPEPSPRPSCVVALLHIMAEFSKDAGDEAADPPLGFDNKNACHQSFSTMRAGRFSRLSIKRGLT